MRVLPSLVVMAAVAGCAPALPLRHFAGSKPVFDPVTFWTGHVQSWGVLEGRGGAPTDTVETDCAGTADGADGLTMHQTIRLGDGTVQHRDWQIRRTGPGAYVATANDMVGEARGEAAGRAFHWRWVLALPATNVVMDQWMYALEDGRMMNRTTIRKLGVVLAEVSEVFAHAP